MRSRVPALSASGKEESRSGIIQDCDQPLREHDALALLASTAVTYVRSVRMKMIRPLFRVERRREGALDFEFGGRGLTQKLCFGSEGPVERAQSQGDGPPQDDCPWA